MAYWRMQLHPSDSANAMRYAVESVAAGFIGLDFETDLGDMRLLNRTAIPELQREYLSLLSPMERGDSVLIVVHHYPFAMVVVDDAYNYIARPEPEIGVWFRHFRRIDRSKTRYFADRFTNAAKWEQNIMTGTIAPLKSPSGQAYQLIESWLSER